MWGGNLRCKEHPVLPIPSSPAQCCEETTYTWSSDDRCNHDGVNGGSEEKSRAEVKMLLQVGTAWGDRLRDVLGHLQGSWAVSAASQGPWAASWVHLGASWGRLRGALGAVEGRAEACWFGKTESSTGVANWSPGRKLAEGRVGGEGPNPRQGSLVSAPRRNEDILRRAEEAHFLRTSHAKSPSRGTTTKVTDWAAIVL